MDDRITVAPVNEDQVMTICDLDGSIILSVTAQECTIFNPDGTATRSRYSTWQTLADNTMWNPTMSWRKEAPVELSVCRICRNPSSSWRGSEAPCHGLIRSDNALRCPTCGVVACPRHVRTQEDGTRLCVRCAGAGGLFCVLRSIFFRRED